ncbi:glycoside hydrolase family 47 protein [Collybia nuda]|uniref:alpha-1,2-Mannosidase n=1 Tax=Collybia nuda TaxID=64659 RepID=A0A9P6CI73_9AGAR|nr:glycoside hydrolase family 47 protein [Collybia nuda]
MASTSRTMRKRKDEKTGVKLNGSSTPPKVERPGSKFPKNTVVLSLVCAGVILLLVQRFELLTTRPHVEDEGKQSQKLTFAADVERRDAVVAAFKHAWLAYERDAMGDDEYHPISGKGTNLTKSGGIGYTVIDSIDTMQIMGLDEEYTRAREWVANKLSFDRDDSFNTFETTIRVLGGLLSAYHLSSGDSLYLERATELADRMLPVFDTPSGLPMPNVNLAKRQGVEDSNSPNVISTAEAATLQLEFRYLSHLTDNEEYWEKVEAVMKMIRAAKLPSALVPIYMGSKSGQFLLSEIRLGSRGDSYYEYLLKQYLQTNQTEPIYREMYEDAMGGISEHLVQKSLRRGLTYTAELVPQRGRTGQIGWHLVPKQDHLVCFLGGSLMLGATTTGTLGDGVSIPPAEDELSEIGDRDWKTGSEILDTCIDTYKGTATGLSPEIVHFRTADDDLGPIGSDWYIRGTGETEAPPYDARYILRPETVESLFIAFRLTGDDRYRQIGWDIFQSINEYCRVETGGFASILNVHDKNSKLEDRMETFMMSETLKYLYLLFSDASVLPLDEYVFNTEAHPLPIFTPNIRTGFS